MAVVQHVWLHFHFLLQVTASYAMILVASTVQPRAMVAVLHAVKVHSCLKLPASASNVSLAAFPVSRIPLASHVEPLTTTS